MRYIQIPTISFTDASGVTRAIKDMREIPAYASRMVINRIAGEPLAFIAQRDDIFGRGHEGDAFLLWEANIVQIADANFDFTYIRKLTVPQI